jgi:putative hydrolase of the HAD superfamily
MHPYSGEGDARNSGEVVSELVRAVEEREVAARLAHGVDTWIFDLDDTLYPRASGLYEQMLARVIELIQTSIGLNATQAAELHAEYYHRYGTSMTGLSRHHGIEPQRFLEFVHQVDLVAIGNGDRLRSRLAALPGRRIVFTNGSRRHTQRVLHHLELTELFSAICDIEACEFVGKPSRVAYDTLLRHHDIEPSRSMMFDDRAVNLQVASELGLKTVLVNPISWSGNESYVDAVTDDLALFLGAATHGGRCETEIRQPVNL